MANTNTTAAGRLTGRGIWIVTVSSMEQIIGAGLSTVIGVMIPMIQMLSHPGMSSIVQGIVGAMGLIGIAVGSVIIGKMSDRQGYLAWFRICPLLILAGALLCIFLPGRISLVIGLFLAGVGVGGGYSLDSAYISELLPPKWRLVMVGVAKATSSIGFIAVAVVCWFILRVHPYPEIADKLMWIIAALAIATFLMRLRWAESPKWLIDKGRKDEAVTAMKVFYGPDTNISDIDDSPSTDSQPAKPAPFSSMFKGENLERVIFSGIPWACEGMGVYGFGVFLPVLVMALGIETPGAAGMHRIVDSVEVTAIVNFFILPGFIIGLLLMNRANHVKMMTRGFILSAIGLAVLYAGYLTHAPHWVLIAGFVIFEMSLNAGPHLITFIIPSNIYPVDDRSTGAGIAAMIGKIGAVAGVIIMPVMIDLGGASLVLIVSMAIMLAGALIGAIYGRILGLTSPKSTKIKKSN